MTPPCAAINADGTIGSLRYVSMLSAGWTATGTSSLRYPEHDCTIVCKGTSVHFLTSPILSHSTLVHMYSPLPPLYQFQGPHLKLMSFRPDSPMTFQKSTHQLLSTSHVPLHSYLSSIGPTYDTLGQACVTLWHPPPSHGYLFVGGLVLGGLVL
jgi:hypothetical protein